MNKKRLLGLIALLSAIVINLLSAVTAFAGTGSGPWP
jgi:hypothetical protein